MIAQVKLKNTFSQTGATFGFSSNTNAYVDATTTDWQYLVLFNPAPSSANAVNLYLYKWAKTNLTGYYLKSAMVIDLTQVFGAGNEPTTVSQFQALFPNDYYADKVATKNTDGSATINYQAIDTTNEIYQYKSSDISLGTGIIEV